MKQIRRSQQEWLELIRECRASGITIKSWCEQHSIPKKSYTNAVARLTAQGLLEPMQGKKAAERQEVVPIPALSRTEEIPQKSDSHAAVTLQFHGCRVEIMNFAAQETIWNTLSVLQQIG